MCHYFTCRLLFTTKRKNSLYIDKFVIKSVLSNLHVHSRLNTTCAKKLFNFDNKSKACSRNSFADSWLSVLDKKH